MASINPSEKGRLVYHSIYQPPARIQAELDHSHELSNWLESKLSTEFTTGPDERGAVAMVFYNLSLDFRESIILLVAMNARSAAQALGRSLLEAFVRGIWFHEVATDANVRGFLAGKYAPKWAGMITGLKKNGFPYAAAIDQHFETLSDYAHGSHRQFSRWRNRGEIFPRHRDDEMVEALSFANYVGLLAATKREELAGGLVSELLGRLQDELNNRSSRVPTDDDLPLHGSDMSAKMCNDCLALEGKLSQTPPHQSLTRLETEKLSGKSAGNTSGYLHHYLCSACKTRWTQDCDRKDSFANWAVRK